MFSSSCWTYTTTPNSLDSAKHTPRGRTTPKMTCPCYLCARMSGRVQRDQESGGAEMSKEHDEYRKFLTAAGYRVTEIDVRPEKNWITVVAAPDR
jgi:hypothetical protein